MRGMIILAIAAVVAAVSAPPFYDRIEDFLLSRDAATSAAPSAQAAPAEVSTSAAKDHMTIPRGRFGAFNVEAEVGGRRVEFQIDPSAFATFLRASDAAWLGIRPSYSDYSARISTRNGVVRGAPVVLDRIAVGSLTAHDVQVIVVPDEVLRQSQLGSSFLKRMHWVQRDGNLELWQ